MIRAAYFFSGAFLMFILMLIASPREVSLKYITNAYDDCASYGGLKSIRFAMMKPDRFTCNNGVRIFVKRDKGEE